MCLPPGGTAQVGILSPSATSLRTHQTPDMPPTAAATRTLGYAILGNCRDPEWSCNGTETVQTADPIMAIASLPISPNEPGACVSLTATLRRNLYDSWRYPPRGRRGASPDPSVGATDDVVATTPPPRNRRPSPCRTRLSRRPSPPTNGSRQEALLATQSWEPDAEVGARNQRSRDIKMQLLTAAEGVNCERSAS